MYIYTGNFFFNLRLFVYIYYKIVNDNEKRVKRVKRNYYNITGQQMVIYFFIVC